MIPPRDRAFRVTMSQRCLPLNPDEVGSHAPRRPGVYQFMAFNAAAKAEVLYVGAAVAGARGTIYDALAAHIMGNLRPSSEDLRKAADNIYFDYISEADVESPEDFKDIAAALIARLKPRLNPSNSPSLFTGRYRAVSVQESI